VTNTGTFVTKFDAEEVRQLYTLRIDWRLCLEWARSRLRPRTGDSKGLVDQLSKPAKPARGASPGSGFAFHKQCGDIGEHLAEILERLMHRSSRLRYWRPTLPDGRQCCASLLLW